MKWLASFQQQTADDYGRLAEAVSNISEKVSRLEREETSLLQHSGNDLALGTDNKIDDRFKEIILGTVRAAVTPMAEFVTERILRLEAKLQCEDTT